MSATDVARWLLVISHRAADMTSMHDVYAMRHGVLARTGPVNSG